MIWWCLQLIQSPMTSCFHRCNSMKRYKHWYLSLILMLRSYTVLLRSMTFCNCYHGYFHLCVHNHFHNYCHDHSHNYFHNHHCTSIHNLPHNTHCDHLYNLHILYSNLLFMRFRFNWILNHLIPLNYYSSYASLINIEPNKR